MQRLQAFKYALMPNGEQQRDMRRFAGSCRFVYNKALALQKQNHEAGNKYIGYVPMAANLPIWKRETGTQWLKETPSQALQHALKDLEKAYKNFFAKRADFPRFKKKSSGDSFRYPDPKQINLDQVDDRILLPKLGWIRYRNSRNVLGEVRNVTVSQSGGKWFESIQTEREVEQPLTTAAWAIGIDVGIARFATLSDESYIAPLNSFKKHQQRLARYQRRMSRKVKFSSNWKKAKAKVQQIHSTIANARKDFLHKATTTISQNHALVCIENLQVKNMSRSSKGNSEQNGKKVAQKSGLNRSILDQGWGEFRRQLAYKVVWHGGMLLAVPPHNTSRTCPACGHVSKDNRQTQAKFLCVDCGYENHADVVGAINILERGYRLLACGESVQSGRSMKQEPTEATHKSSRSAVGIPVLLGGEDVNFEHLSINRLDSHLKIVLSLLCIRMPF
ncbi:transposase [Undibacterium sp. 5I1]|uniref:RNA-guided endonuclease InsQ/TnpB family protein n=1 Tax=unclassified Undibacterium TaxID=2630295 RepID=UPI002AB3B76F|nr:MULTISPECIES: transposase [unclassified Undibacterium]MDY7537882.1 transposase [Undibacterium sp. 5I1]MEB0230356.1 transposase [Undibacterium sp. 10I3]MEB0259747.1 transposase [Undibacterium sp. 5I1]